jgi:GT2 family glycosyltransferase
LLDAVRALERQTFRNFQVIVVDNASTDGSICRLRANAPQVQIVQAEQNLGFAAANNLAVRRAPAARWIALLNPDAFPEPDWLAELMRAALAHPDCASIASRTLDASDPNVLDGAGDAYHASGRHWRAGTLRRGGGSRQSGVFGSAAAALREAAWMKSAVHERFFGYAEDVDLGFRLRLQAIGAYAPIAVARHSVGHPASVAISPSITASATSSGLSSRTCPGRSSGCCFLVTSR